MTNGVYKENLSGSSQECNFRRRDNNKDERFEHIACLIDSLD